MEPGFRGRRADLRGEKIRRVLQQGRDLRRPEGISPADRSGRSRDDRVGLPAIRSAQRLARGGPPAIHFGPTDRRRLRAIRPTGDSTRAATWQTARSPPGMKWRSVGHEQRSPAAFSGIASRRAQVTWSEGVDARNASRKLNSPSTLRRSLRSTSPAYTLIIQRLIFGLKLPKADARFGRRSPGGGRAALGPGQSTNRWSR